MGSLYKILPKILANRLKKVLHKVIEKSQNVFWGGSKMLDGVVIAKENSEKGEKKETTLSNYKSWLWKDLSGWYILT